MSVSRPTHFKLGASIDWRNQAGRDTRVRPRWFSGRHAGRARTVISRASLKDSILRQG
jgi:hypothetical protein